MCFNKKIASNKKVLTSINENGDFEKKRNEVQYKNANIQIN